MAYSKAHYNLRQATGPATFNEDLGLQNLGVSIHVFAQGEGFDFFHNHREQEEVYFCLEGTAVLKVMEEGGEPQSVELVAGDIVRVDARTLRAIGNASSPKAVVLIAGACPHPYPAGVGHHDVIADVLKVTGQGQTGFTLPPYVKSDTHDHADEEC